MDFGAVRIHTGQPAAEMNSRLRAQAFTHGRDIYFGAGKYSSGSPSTRRLLAHELVHVMQQGDSPAMTSSHPPDIQRATIDPDMDRRYHHSRSRDIRAALVRYPNTINLALSALERYQRQNETETERNAVALAFNITRQQPGWQGRIQSIINTYNSASAIIASPDCRITFNPDELFYGMCIPDQRWLIEIGLGFFLRRRPMWWNNSEYDLALHQVLVLLHEAIHYVNGAGHLQEPSQNPFNLSQFILDLGHGPVLAGTFREWYTTRIINVER